MTQPELLASTGEKQVDDTVRQVVSAMERQFPNRVRGYYLTGSYADGTAGPLSDIDGVVLFADGLTDAEREAARSILSDCSRLTARRLDIGVTSEADFEPTYVSLKADALLIYGVDTRSALPWPDPAVYISATVEVALLFIGQWLRGTETVRFPLAYPDPDAPFYGYTRVRIPQWYPPGTESGIKELVTSVTRIASAVVALRGGRFVGTKSGSVEAYAADVDDDWTPYLRALVGKGKGMWGYLLPSSAQDKLLLHELCGQTLGFENHFLTLLRSHLLTLLHDADEEHTLRSLDHLQHVAYLDAAFLGALETLVEAGSHELAGKVREILQIYATRG